MKINGLLSDSESLKREKSNQHDISGDCSPCGACRRYPQGDAHFC